MRISDKILTFIFAAAMSPLCCLAQQGSVLDAGKIIKDGALNVPVYRVSISADNAEDKAIASKVFNMHGSYVLVKPSEAQFEFRFARGEGNSVGLTISGATTVTTSCFGSSPTDALMRACDMAVEKTLRSPGFFASKVAFSYSAGSRSKISEICVSDIPFKNVKKITSDNSESLMPHISPDGSKILYTGYYNSGFMDLIMVDLDKKTRRIFSSFKGSNTGGSFSRDGSKVALILSASGNAEVWTANASGGGFKRMTRTSATESSPCFSPDGSKLVFASDSRGGPQIYVMSSSGGKPKMLATRMSRYASEPVWNPVNQDLIAFTAAVGKGFQVAVYDMKTGVSKWVTSGANSSEPAWLADGRHLICTKKIGASSRLYVVDTETLRQTPLHSAGFGSTSGASAAYVER